MMHRNPSAHVRLVWLGVLGLGAVLLAGWDARAQPPTPARPPLRPELSRAAEQLAHHPHPYAMSEEVARVRLEKMGFERAQSLRATEGNAFQAEVMKNGQPQKVEIDRITGAVKAVP